MSRSCDLFKNKGVQVGHKVSHSMRKTKKRFKPNLQNATFKSDVLGESYSMRVPASTIRSVDHNHGLDTFLLTTACAKLTEYGRSIKRKIQRKLKMQSVAS